MTALSFNETAQHLGVTELTVSIWACTGLCPTVVTGTGPRVPAQWVEDLLALGWKRTVKVRD